MKRQLIQSTLWIEQEKGHAFNIDTVLLAHFVKLNYRIKTVLDVGTGNGAIALYLSEKTKAHIIGIEIQKNRYVQALKNVELNHLEAQIEILHEDYLNTSFESVDVIVCNPPFFKISNTSNLNADDSISIARHEVSLDLESLIKKVSQQLKYSGKFFMIHRPSRLIEIINLCEKYQLTIKRLQFIYPYLDRQANHVLIECVKNGKDELRLEPPLILYEGEHQLTDKAEKILGGELNAT